MNIYHRAYTLLDKKANQRLIAAVLVAFSFNFLISPAFAVAPATLATNAYSRSGNRVVIKSPNSELKRVEKLSMARPTHTSVSGVPEIAKTFALAPTPVSPTLVAMYQKKKQNKDFSIALADDIPDGRRMFVTLTAYNSEPAQTDGDPCTSANGENLCKRNIEDTVATNALPFGTRIMVPELFGNHIFVVRDRTNKRYTTRVDVWMKSRADALQFGVKHAEIVVVE